MNQVMGECLCGRVRIIATGAPNRSASATAFQALGTGFDRPGANG